MRRYTVQVVDGPTETQSVTQSSSPVQPAQPVLSGVPQAEAPSVSTRKFVVEAVPDTPNSKETKTQVEPSPTHSPSEAPPVSKEAPSEAFSLPSPTPQVTNPKPTEPPDYWQQRQAAFNQLMREERIQSLPEEPMVRTPRRETEAKASKLEKTPANPLGAKKHKLQRIEGFYQKRVKPSFSAATAPSGPSFWQKHRWLIGGTLSLLMIGGALGLSVMAVKADVEQTMGQAQALVEDLKSSRFTSAQERQITLDQKLNQYNQVYQVVRPVVRLTQGNDKTTHLDRLFTVLDHGLEIVDTSLQLYGDLDRGYRQFVGEEEGESVETFTHLTGQFESLFTQLAQLQGEIGQLGNPYQLEILTELDKQVNRELPDLRKSVLTAQKVSVVLPELLGEKEEKTYLVLFQNNAELRPTGGFIGSLALLTLKDGKLQDFKVEDVYEVDGQLNGFVTPPEEIVQYLDEEQWFLRDVNWSPDFPKVAQRASWFLEKSMGVQVDGVVAINLDVAKKLLAVTGPLEVVDYNEVITADNLYEQAQMHSELNFFPGSNGKKDFLSAVSTQILNQVFYGEANKLLLARALLQSAEESELFVSFSQPKLEETFASLGWNGKLLTPECPAPFEAQGCFVDTIMQVEANVGVNKSNQFVTRTIDHQAEILNDRVRHTRTITIENASQSEAWPAGKYKVYLRLFVTKGSKLRSVMEDGQAVDLLSIRTPEEDGKQVFGYFVEVPIKGQKELVFFYETNLPTDLKTYALFEQKQSGTAGDSVTHVVDVGERSVEVVAPEPVINGRQMSFTSDRHNHQFIGIEF